MSKLEKETKGEKETRVVKDYYYSSPIFDARGMLRYSKVSYSMTAKSSTQWLLQGEYLTWSRTEMSLFSLVYKERIGHIQRDHVCTDML